MSAVRRVTRRKPRKARESKKVSAPSGKFIWTAGTRGGKRAA